MHNFKTICLSALLLMTGAVSVSAQGTSETAAEKFFMSITDKNGMEATFTVWENYNFKFVLPYKGTYLSAESAEVYVRMTEVNSLDVNNKREYRNTINTGATGITSTLDYYMKNVYEFTSSNTWQMKVIDGDDKENFTYTISASGDKVYDGIASPESDARKAWAIIARNNTQTSIEANEDSHTVIKAGAYLRMGDEDLLFNKNDTLAAGILNFGEFIKAVKNDSEVVQKNGLTGTDRNIFELYIPEGSVLQLGGTKAVLKKNMTITIDLSAIGNSSAFEGVLTQFANGTNSTTSAIPTTLSMIDKLAGMLLKTPNVPITVEFGPKKRVLLGDLDHNDELNVVDITAMVNIILQKDVDPSVFKVKGATKTYNLANTTGNGAWLLDSGDYGINVGHVTPLVNMILQKDPYIWIEVR